MLLFLLLPQAHCVEAEIHLVIRCCISLSIADDTSANALGAEIDLVKRCCALLLLAGDAMADAPGSEIHLEVRS